MNKTSWLSLNDWISLTNWLKVRLKLSLSLRDKERLRELDNFSQRKRVEREFDNYISNTNLIYTWVARPSFTIKYWKLLFHSHNFKVKYFIKIFIGRYKNTTLWLAGIDQYEGTRYKKIVCKFTKIILMTKNKL